MYLYTTLHHHQILKTLSHPFFISSLKTMKKKQSVYSVAILLFLLFIISSSKSSARFLETKRGEEDQKLKEIISGTSLIELESSEESADLMGMEECDKEDDECLKRRIMAEAHLDYIYTQHHKP